MRILLFLLGLPLFSQPVISNFAVREKSHSCVNLIWISNPSTANYRIRYGTTTKYGSKFTPRQLNRTTQGGNVCGLMPGTTYHFIAESSADGDKWSASSDLAVTTHPAPPVDPAPPRPPASFQTSYPDTSNYVKPPKITGNCSTSLMNELRAAFARQETKGTVITLDPSVVCGGRFDMPFPAGLKVLTPSNFSNDNGSLLVKWNDHKYSNGNEVRFDTDGCLPNSSTSRPYSNCQFNGVLRQTAYYVRDRTENSFHISATPGGPAVSFVNAGSGNSYMIKFPLPSNWIVIRTSTPDGSFVPEGVRVWPAWSRLMPKMRNNSTGMSNNASVHLSIFNHHIRFVGLQWDTEDRTAAADRFGDPAGFSAHAYGRISSSDIVFDRNIFTKQGDSTRLYSSLYFMDGVRIAVVDSYFYGLELWQGAFQGEAPQATATTVSVKAATISGGNKRCTVKPSVLTVSDGGGISGTGHVGVRWSDCTWRFTLPQGVSATATNGAVVANTARGARICENGNCEDLPLNTISFSGGNTTGLGGPSVNYSESFVGSIIGNGPGPLKFSNNHFQGSGILFHHDGSGAGVYVPCDIDWQRNRFVHSAATPKFGQWETRNLWECKQCCRVRFNGNVLEGQPGDVGVGYAAVVTPREDNAIVRDLDFTNNTFSGNGAGIYLWGGVIHPTAYFGARYRLHNNVIETAGWTAVDPFSSRAKGTSGEGVVAGGGLEDYIMSHNTIRTKGTSSAFLRVYGDWSHGWAVKDNLFIFSNDAGNNGLPVEWGPHEPDCSNLNGKAGLDCVLRTGYVWSNNLLVGQYTNSASSKGNYNPGSAYRGLKGTLIARGSSAADRISKLQLADSADSGVRLSQGSPYAAKATGGTSIGADMDKLDAEQGKVSNEQVLHIRPAGENGCQSKAGEWCADVSLTAPDAAGCSVDLYTADPLIFRRFSNAGGARAQIVKLSGLKGKTKYNARINCSSEQPVLEIQTN